MNTLTPKIIGAGTPSVVIHFRHARRGYVGSIIIENGEARSAKVSFSPAGFRDAAKAASAALQTED